MSTALARKITAAISAAAASAGIFAGIAFAPASANAAPPPTANCTTTTAPIRAGLSSPNPLTRAAQVDAIEQTADLPAAPFTCVGH